MLYSLVAFTRYDLLGLSGFGAGIGQNVEKLLHLSLVYAPDDKVMDLDNLRQVDGGKEVRQASDQVVLLLSGRVSRGLRV